MGLKRFFCLFAALLVIIIAVKSEPSLQTLHQWSQLTYDQDYDNFKPENNILGNVRSYKSNLYVSVPRWRDGVPSTLNVLQENGKLRPFPNLDLNQVGHCQNLQNVASLEVVGSILWVVDSGTSAIFSRPNKQCSAKLIRMDLEKAEMRIFHVFSREMVPENSVILQLVVDQGKFYMANAIQGSILVFDSRAKRSQLVKSEFMAPKNHPISLSNGQMTYLRLGVTSLTLQNIGKEQMLIFGSLEKELYTFPTSNFSIISKVNRVKGIGGEAMVADNQKTIFMALADKPHVHRWNVSQPISQAQTIIEDANLNWINSMWIDQGFLWMTHNNFLAYTSSSLDLGQANNFGIHRMQMNAEPYQNNQGEEKALSKLFIPLMIILKHLQLS